MTKVLPPGHGGYTGASKPREGRQVTNPTMRVRSTPLGPLEPPDDPLGPARGCLLGCLVGLMMFAIIGLIILTAIHHH